MSRCIEMVSGGPIGIRLSSGSGFHGWGLFMRAPGIPARRRIGSSHTAVIYDGGIFMDTETTEVPLELIYVSPMLLEPGSVVPPGNYGKNVFGHTPARGMDGWILARELIFERARLMLTPHLPSRLNCNFLFTSAAAAFQGSQNLSASVLSPCVYRVELVDPTAPSCQADFDTFNAIDVNNFADSAYNVAMRYWTSASTGDLREGCLPEMLTTSSIRIVQALSGNVNLHNLYFPVLSNAGNGNRTGH